MNPLVLFQEIGISLALGLLVGLQRERTDSDVAGIRTFPLISVFGTLCAILTTEPVGVLWILPAGMIAMIGVILVGNLPKVRQENADAGVTTEIAMLVMFLVGALIPLGPWSVAVVVGCGTAVLLHLKPQMHGFATRMGEVDFRGIMQFVLITFIILPVLPNRSYDPLAWIQPLVPHVELAEVPVLNPYEVWLLVVLVVGISLGGYVSYKLFGREAGIVLGGILGGTISSTATTVSYARRTAQAPTAAGMAAIVIMIASTVTFVRVLIEIAVVAPAFLPVAAGPILVMFGASVALSVGMWLLVPRGDTEMPAQENPTDLRPAMVFAAMYAIVVVAVAVSRAYLPDQYLYAIAALSGMTDMDAITLATARNVRAQVVQPDLGWRLIVVATMANLAFKGLVVGAMGSRDLFRRVAVLFGLALLSGVGVLLFWPV